MRISKRMGSVLIGAGIAVAQPVSLGVKGGVPLTDAFETLRGNNQAYATKTKRYVVGPAVQLNFPARISLEGAALYKRLGYQYEQFTPSSPASVSVAANAWEFPVTLKYALVPGPVRPYLETGASFRHISGIQQVENVLNAAGSVVSNSFNNAAEFNKRTDVGFVFGGGLEFKIQRLRVSPGIRYTRWGSENFRDPINSLLRTNRNQADFLLGLMF